MATGEWIREAREAYLGEAEGFLRERGLLAPDRTLGELSAQWPALIQQQFDPSQPDAFYRGWVGDTGASNVAVNIVDQFSRGRVVKALSLVFASPGDFRGRWLDFGCGTAAIALNWQRTFAPRSTLLLADVENLPNEFIRHSAKKHPEYAVEFHGVGLAEVAEGSLDFVLCVDVLEHLPNPSEVFKRLHSRLRSGGMLLLQAPWGGHPEHLPEAPIDWASNGGQALLAEAYMHVAQIDPGIKPSGLYWKRLG